MSTSPEPPSLGLSLLEERFSAQIQERNRVLQWLQRLGNPMGINKISHKTKRDSKTSVPKHCGQRILATSHLQTGNREPGTGNRIYRDWAIDLKENLIQQGLEYAMAS